MLKYTLFIQSVLVLHHWLCLQSLLCWFICEFFFFVLGGQIHDLAHARKEFMSLSYTVELNYQPSMKCFWWYSSVLITFSSVKHNTRHFQRELEFYFGSQFVGVSVHSLIPRWSVWQKRNSSCHNGRSWETSRKKQWIYPDPVSSSELISPPKAPPMRSEGFRDLLDIKHSK